MKQCDNMIDRVIMQPIPYDIVANAFMVLFAALGVFLTVYNVWKAIRDMRKPHVDHLAQVANHDSEIAKNSAKLDEIQGEMHMMLDGHIMILEHIITGNHIDKLKEHKGMVVRYLINHRGNSDEAA